MATRAGRKWLVLGTRFGPFVARSDSPIVHEKKRVWSWRSDFEFDTLGEAYLRLDELRQHREHRP